jgi:hypothetical protein
MLVLLVSIIAVLSTTLGQSFLLHLIFPDIMAIYGSWIVIGLLFFNSGLTGLVLFLYRDFV